MQILVLLDIYFDAVVVFVTSQTLLFKLALTILWHSVAHSTMLSSKPELLQLNRTQFPSLGIFISKKVGFRKKTKTT